MEPTRRRRVRRWPIALLGAAGLASVLGSLLPGPGYDSSWLRDFLMTVGLSVGLFLPFYWITRSLDDHLDRVAADTAEKVDEVRADTAVQVEAIRQEAADASKSLTSQVAELRADVDQRLDDAVERVRERLRAEAQANRDAISSLRTAGPDRDVFWDAFARAEQLGLITHRRAPRVNISKRVRLYVSVEIDTGDFADEPLQLRVEDVDGRVFDWIPWPADAHGDDVLVAVGQALFKHTGEEFDPALLFIGLADLLEAAMSHPHHRPAIELCPPQWMVCEWGVTTYDGRDYGVNLRQLQKSPSIESHVAGKTWVDRDSWECACLAALALFPGGSGADPWAASDEPPF